MRQSRMEVSVRVMSTTLERLKPEAAYFTTVNGDRGGFIVFDLKHPSDIPSICEPFFMELGAKVELTPVMTPDDVQAGLAKAFFLRPVSTLEKPTPEEPVPWEPHPGSPYPAPGEPSDDDDEESPPRSTVTSAASKRNTRHREGRASRVSSGA